MAFTAADIAMVDDHIAQGERHVARQQEIVAWLRSRGHPTDMAEQLLADFRATLVQHRDHREMMLREREPNPLLPTPRATARRPANPARKKG